MQDVPLGKEEEESGQEANIASGNPKATVLRRRVSWQCGSLSTLCLRGRFHSRFCQALVVTVVVQTG